MRPGTRLTRSRGGLRAVAGVRAVVGVGTVAVAVVVLGLTLGASTTRRYPFSHLEHQAREPSLTCIECHDLTHTAPATSPVAGRPSLRTARCAECHDDDVPAVAARAGSATLAVTFDHAPHASVLAAAGSCTLCHVDAPRESKPAATLDAGPATDPERVEHRLVATSATCFACHAKHDDAPQEQACTACHSREQRAVPPSTHGASWRKSHGASASPFAPQPHGQSCTLCHRESTCKSCHRVEKPESHSALWAERTHGIVASFDSARCKTCHETGQCISCHRSTEPKNHDGAWKATHGLVARSKSDTTCATCHKPSFCLDCHRGGR